MKKLGMLTGGGDCGGLNAVIKGAASMANANDVELYAIPNGYAGLYNLVDFDELVKFDEERLDQFRGNLAGAETGNSRVKIKKIENPDKYERIKKGLKKHNINGLVISGGDDTGSVMVDLSNKGIQCVHAPKTMDLDLQTYSVGGDSTINRIAKFVQDLKTTGRTHNRIIVTEVFGRYAGHTAFRGGVAAEADCILIPEIPVEWDIVYDHLKKTVVRRIKDSDVHAGTYAIVVAEGLQNADGTELTDESAGVDAFGHKKLAGAGKYARQQIENRMDEDPEIKQFMKDVGLYVEGVYEALEIRHIVPEHLVRCGDTSAYDTNFGFEAGAAAVLLLMDGKSGVTVSEVDGGTINYIPAEKAIQQRHVDLEEVALYETLGTTFGRAPQQYKPKFNEFSGKVGRIY